MQSNGKTLIEEMKRRWIINSNYWFPLDGTERSDLLVLDDLEIEKNKKIEDIILILSEIGIMDIYEMREDKSSIIPRKIEDLRSLYVDDYHWMNESYWFDESLTWIIYRSHEQTFTVGGDKVIVEISTKWHDLENLKSNRRKPVVV